MGKVITRRKTGATKPDRDRTVDKWFSRASHGSQVLLLVLGVFGYFYTVLPVYQKSLLDEEIAQKTIELREQEKRAAALNSLIDQKKTELAERDRQVVAAKTTATVAKNEARRNYMKLRAEYVIAALGQLPNCTSPFHKKEPDGAEFKKCPAEMTQRVDHMLADLRGEDVQLLMSLTDQKVIDLDPQFQRIISEYSMKKEAARSELEALERQEAEPRSNSIGNFKDPAFLKSMSDRFSKLMEARNADGRIRTEAYSQYRKLLQKAADEIREVFFARAST